MDTRMVSDGSKSCIMVLSGILGPKFGSETVLTFASLQGPPTKMRLDSVTWALGRDAEFNLWWTTNDPYPGWRIIMPIGGRGYTNFEQVTGIHSAAGATGIGISTVEDLGGDTAFMIILDLTKQ